MKHLIVYAHPQTESFNHAILETTVKTLEKKGHQVNVRNLYDLDFQPVLRQSELESIRRGETLEDVKQEQEYITQADSIILIYPIWWTGLPAILKGYIDRVFAYGFAYSYEGNGIKQHLTEKKGIIINTHGTPKEIYDQMSMTEALKLTSSTGIFEFTGIEPMEHLLFGSIPDEELEMKKNLHTVENSLHRIF
ncbi:NAD(P)H-dependent oxidoreductase [Shimazuella kribbensis]|uniref:NAD(P)H-dependent oxidoreductase n=1 Tax=Shimazuella kribbensis TaxID=139808 RepID=UPI0004082ECD|nr:NAD(P)H-dependent oxidoreductase [Shimazuella kribbensis]